jgi:hypothetical protein
MSEGSLDKKGQATIWLGQENPGLTFLQICAGQWTCMPMRKTFINYA